MDGRGRYLDNIFVERLWRTVKQECIYLNEFASVIESATTRIAGSLRKPPIRGLNNQIIFNL